MQHPLCPICNQRHRGVDHVWPALGKPTKQTPVQDTHFSSEDETLTLSDYHRRVDIYAGSPSTIATIVERLAEHTQIAAQRNQPHTPLDSNAQSNSDTQSNTFDKVAYQRDYMRRRRAKQRSAQPG